MTTRAALIAELADDVSHDAHAGKYDATFFLDTLIDDQAIKPAEIAGILVASYRKKMEAIYAIRRQVMTAALEFFTNDQRGIDYISDQLATRTASESDDLREVDLAGRIRDSK